MAAGLATPQDVRLNEPGPICQDSKKRRPFAGEYACLGMRSLRVRFRKSTRLGVNSGTKAEMSHGECEDQGASSDCLSARPGVSCRGEAINLQQPPKPRLHPWDNSVFVPESRARGVLFARRSKIPTEYQEDTEAPDLLTVNQLTSLTAHQPVCSTARAPQSPRGNEAQILN